MARVPTLPFDAVQALVGCGEAGVRYGPLVAGKGRSSEGGVRSLYVGGRLLPASRSQLRATG